MSEVDKEEKISENIGKKERKENIQSIQRKITPYLQEENNTYDNRCLIQTMQP